MLDITTDARARVVVAGAGMAGMETALAVRAFAGNRAVVTMVDPGRRFAVPATAAGSAFGIAPSVDLALEAAVSRAGATLRRSRVVAVDARRRLAMLEGGELLGFESLVIAVGARPVARIPEALTFRGHADVAGLRALVSGVSALAARGRDSEVAVVIPARCGWPLTGYEIALMAREEFVAAGHGDACRVRVLTAEAVPLSRFGRRAQAAVTGKLGRLGISIVAGCDVVEFDWGRLITADGASHAADRVIALPVMRGPGIAGVPMDDGGFVVCDAEGCVANTSGVRVIGDAGAFALMRGGIACRQADAVAAAIARGLGAAMEAVPFAASLPEWLWDEGEGWLPHNGAAGAAPAVASAERWPVPKMSGRFLAPFLHEGAKAAIGAAALG